MARRKRFHGWLSAGLALALLAIGLPACADAAPVGSAGAGAAIETPVETPLVLQASDVLPADLLRGSDFEVAPKVQNDGFMNRYLLKTTWGSLEVVSTPLLRKRVRETAALRQLEDVSKTDEFGEAAKKSWDAVVSGAKGLVHDPEGSASKVSSGVKKLFGKAKGRASAEQLQPHDLLYWTDDLKRLLGAIDPALADAPKKTLWLGGSASEQARQVLSAAGWTVRADPLARLRRD